MSNVNITINNIDLSVEQGTTILNAAKKIEIELPSLCKMEMKDIGFIHHISSCRVCLVEVLGRDELVPACSTPISEGMIIFTNTIKVMANRRLMIELLLSNHPKDCLYCPKNQKCDLQALAAKFGVREIRFATDIIQYPLECTKSIVRNPNKCIRCRRCEAICRDIQTCNVLSQINRGEKAIVQTSFCDNLENPENKACTFCGQCVAVCPVASLYETDFTWKLIEDISNKNKKVIVQVAPSVRAALGEEFGYEAGTNITGKMVSALKKMGFYRVFDTDFGADMTVMEEAAEFKERLEKYLKGEKNVRLPLLTSCCPAWVNFIEYNYPEMLDIPSSAKSPMEIFGSIAKNIWAKEQGLEREDIICVAVMPCLAKKYESGRKEFYFRDNPDVDYVITTRELARIMKEMNIDLTKMEDNEFDSTLGESTGAGTIFGRTGGVIEATIRTAYEWITSNSLENIDFYELRGLEGIRVAQIEIGGEHIKVGIAHGLGSARKLLEKIKNGEETFHAIEIMACKGGCVGGGGQPYHHGNFEIIKKRIACLQEIDTSKTLRKSHLNPYVQDIYNRYLSYPLSKEAKRLLHTEFYPKKNEI